MPPGKSYKNKSKKTYNKMSKKNNLVLMKKVAEDVLDENLETKFVTENTNLVAFNGIISNPGEYYSLIPSIQRGVGNWQLAQNALTPLQIKTEFIFGITDVTRTVNVICVLYCLQSKRVKDFPLLAQQSAVSGTYPNCTNNILKTGDSGEATSFNGTPINATFPTNTNEFKLLKKYVFRLSKNVGAQNGDIGGQQSTCNPNMADGVSVKRITYIHKNHPKQLKYAPDGSALLQYPNNHAPFWCFGYYKPESLTPDTGFQSVTVTASTQMFYKDA